MDEDTEQAAWHQLELEAWQWLLEHDPEYIEWLESVNTTKEPNSEIPRETQ